MRHYQHSAMVFRPSRLVLTPHPTKSWLSGAGIGQGVSICRLGITFRESLVVQEHVDRSGPAIINSTSTQANMLNTMHDII